MRFAIISDIHGNIHALKAVLKELENQSIDSYLYLGDNIGDLPYPNEVAELLRKQSKNVVIGGNKESYLIQMTNDIDKWQFPQFNAMHWNYSTLKANHRNYLMNLPTEQKLYCEGKRILLIHDIESVIKSTCLKSLIALSYSDRMNDDPFNHEEFLEYVYKNLSDDEDFCRALESFDADIIIFGHTHIQWETKIKKKILINAGSCGMPLDYTQGAAYTILEIGMENIVVDERRANYDIEGVINCIKKSEMYQHAEDWCNIAIDQLNDSRNYFVPFLKHAKAVSNLHGLEWPIKHEAWDEIIQSWIKYRPTILRTC